MKFKDFINYDKRIGKIIISGVEGSGKTMLLTAIAIGKMLNGLQDCWKSFAVVDDYNSLGFNFSKAYEHLCFGNFPVNCKNTFIPLREIYRCNPYRLGLFDEMFETEFYPPYSLFCITEAYNVFNAYLFDKFRDSFKGFIKTTRHAKYDMVLDTQYFGDICTIFRRITNRFLYLSKPVEELHDLKGKCIGHKFHIIEWNSNRDAELFERTSKLVNHKEYDLVVDQCLYENFDTEFCKYLHLVGRQMQDFNIDTFSKINDVADLENMEEEFGTIPPEGFFAQKRAVKFVEPCCEGLEDLGF